MSGSGRLTAGVAAALAAAACFGVASVLQHRAAREAPRRRVGQVRLMLDLLRQATFRWSLALTGVAFALQVVALKLAPLAVVQPLLVTGLLWYVLVSAWLVGHRPDLVLIGAALGSLACLSGFLLLADPKLGTGHLPGLATTLSLAIPFGVIVAGCLLASVSVLRRWRSLTLALAAGVCYGVTAGLVRSLAPVFRDGLVPVLSRWQPYAILVVGQLGVLLSQHAYQAGRMGSPALTIMTITDPLVSIVVGQVWLGERMRTAVPWAAGEAGVLLVLAGFVYLLAARAPHVRDAEPD